MAKPDKNAKALISAYDLYAEKLYRYVFLRVNSKETTQDLVSNVFLKTWDYIRKEKIPIKNYQAFLYRVAHNLLVDYYKEKSRAAVSLEELNYNPGVLAQDSNLTEISHNKLEMEKVKKAMEKLKPEYREIISLRFVADLSIKEIAQVQEKSENAVSILIHRAIKELRQMLS